MGLDMHKTAPLIQDMTGGLRAAGSERLRRLDRALRLFDDPLSASPLALTHDALRKRVEATGPPRRRMTWLVAGLPQASDPVAAISARLTAPDPPADYATLATDGSQIGMERHGPAQLFLINIGGAWIRYGGSPGAELFNEPRLYSEPQDLVIADDSGLHEQPIDEPLLAVKRLAMECEALATRIEAAPVDLPVLALLDGSLILWTLSGKRYGDHVRQKLLQEGFLQAMDRIRVAAEARPIAFASYISRSQSRDVVNLLRVAWCPHEDAAERGCDAICGRGGPGSRECGEVALGLTDSDLFEAALAPGQRSAVFSSMSSIVLSDYGRHEIRFFYVNMGDEIVRLELPEWMAQQPQSVGLLHGLVLDQCQKGGGYPVALQEAHEQAVVTAADRRQFWSLVEHSLATGGVASAASQKARSKRVRAV